MLKPVRTLAIACAMLALTLAGPAFSQGSATATDVSEVEPMFISIEADPNPGWISDHVKLTGQTMGRDGQNTVTLVITPPDEDGKPKDPTTLTTDVDANGIYLAVFEDTLTPGKYKVKVTAPDQRGTAEAEFDLLDAPDVPDVVEVVEDIGRVAQDHIDNVVAQIEDLPASPAKDEMKKKLADARARLAEFKSKLPETKAAIENLVTLSATEPDMAEARTRLIKSFTRGKQLVQRSQEELDRLRLRTVTCDNLEVVIEGLKWVSTMLDFFATSVLEVAKNFGKELLGFYASKASTAAGAPDLINFGATEAAKNVDSIAKRQLEIPTVIGLVTDAGVFAAQKVMEHYCQVFTGPVSGTMKAEFYTGSIMWWSYSFSVTGTVTVHYPKDVGPGRIPVKGRIEGYGHNFKMWENALTNLYPELMSSAVQTKRMIPPIEAGPGINEKVESLGSVAATVMPNSFFIAVEGSVDDDRITLQLGPARTDMTAKARVLAIILSPLVTFPVFTSYELPFKEARFVFERATKGQEMVLPIETTGKTMKAHEIFSDKKDGGEAKGEYSIDIKMCNPGCGG